MASGSRAASAKLMLLSSAPMAGVESSTLIEWRRTDGRTMAVAFASACEAIFWGSPVAFIDASNLCSGRWPSTRLIVGQEAARPFVQRDNFFADWDAGCGKP